MLLRFEQTGEGFIVTSEHKGAKEQCREITAAEFKEALTVVVDEAQEKGHVAGPSDIGFIGVRIVAPATYFTEHRIIDGEYVKKLKELEPIDPPHIPAMLLEIEGCQKFLPKAKCVGVSDSAFHITADPVERATSLPREDVERFDLRRFGYHGISVASIVKHIEARDGGVPERMVVCHIGSGVSITAVKGGKSVANSMGNSPASGVMMSSRMGDVPAGMLAAAITRKGLKGNAIYDYLFNEGGFMGVTGVRDMRLVLDRAAKQDKDAEFALSMFANQIKSYIARYAMLMGGLDTIVLTATAAERNPAVRSLVVGHLPLFHTYVHDDRNEALLNSEGYIQTDDSDVKILVLKTDELGEMYRILMTFA